MAEALALPSKPLSSLMRSDLGRMLALGAGIAIAIGVMAGVWSYQSKPEYRVLLSGYSDRDGGAIIDSLQQMNVPYKFAEGGGAILVPADRVHDVRLRLAGQGLPKGSTVGFELMEKQKLGVSQFHEQVNYQRALEGELARSIGSVDVIESARVHLAIPKPSVFLKDRQAPTASVMIQVAAGRTLSGQQVQAIVHLVSSSVPELSSDRVTLVDQNGRLLSSGDRTAASLGPDPSQLKYAAEVQTSMVKRIEAILSPLYGAENIRAQANAEIDFSRVDQAAETYKPNATPESSAIRAQNTREARSTDSSTGGIAGAASNQPESKGKPSSNAASGNTNKDQSIQYELDKTIRVTQQPMGGIKRLSVAVVLNHKPGAEEDAKPVPPSPEEMEQATRLVKEAIGFNADRGDTVTVTSSLFAQPKPEVIEKPAFYEPYLTLENAASALKTLGSLVLLFLLYTKVLKPLIQRTLEAAATDPEGKAQSDEPALNLPMSPSEAGTPQAVRSAPLGPAEQNLATAKAIALQEPRVVATVVKSWVGGE